MTLSEISLTKRYDAFAKELLRWWEERNSKDINDDSDIYPIAENTFEIEKEYHFRKWDIVSGILFAKQLPRRLRIPGFNSLG